MAFEFSAQAHTPLYLFALKGAMTSASLAKLAKGVECARSMGHKILLFDLQKTTLIDSSGMGFLLRLYKDLRSADGRIGLISPSPRVAKTLADANVLKIFRVYESLREARDELGGMADTEDRGFYLLVRMPREVNLEAVGPLRTVVNSAIAGDTTQIVFDMSNTKLITSVGIGLLTNVQRILKEKGGGAGLVGIGEEVRAALETTNVLRVLPVYPTLEDAEEKLM